MFENINPIKSNTTELTNIMYCHFIILAEKHFLFNNSVAINGKKTHVLKMDFILLSST